MGRKIILTLTLIIILAIAGVLYFYYSKTPTDTTVNTPGFFKSIFPFGSNSTPSTSSEDSPLIIGDAGNNNTNILKSLPRLRHYTTEPTPGNTIIERDKDVIRDRVKVTEKEVSVRYMDRATGHIFDAVTSIEAQKKISNTTIPKVYEAIFVPGGDSLVTRFLDDNENIITYYITLKDKKLVVASTTARLASTTPTVASKAFDESQKFKDVTGTYLSKNIQELALSTSGKKILNLVYGGSGGIISTLDSALKSKTVLSHPLREWLLSYPSDTRAVITTKPSGITYGYSYILNTDTGAMQKLVGNILGMTILPNRDLSAYLVGQASESLQLFSLLQADSAPTSLGINTLPEKCIWANTSLDIAYCAVPKAIPNAVYPDDWYKGRLFFNDSLWKINIKTGETNLISNLSQEGGQPIDAINLEISASDKYLTFINKRDLTLWGIDLTVN